MKKQHFTSSDLEKLKADFNIKNTPGEWDTKHINKLTAYTKYIKWIPGLRMIGIGNSTSMNAGKQSSDIDLYIVTTQNRLWLVRILLTLIFQILGVRKTGSKHAGRFCLSFFSTEAGMDFSKFSLERDPYLFLWTLYFKPVLNYNNSYEKFIKINSELFNLDDFQEIISENKKHIFYSSLKSETNNYIINSIEKILKKIFLPRTKKSFQKIGKPFGVIINDDLLKFHDNDIRKEVSHKV